LKGYIFFLLTMVKAGIVAAPLLLAVDGLRKGHKSSSPQVKAIAGVPVLNYEGAFGGQPSWGQLERDAEEEWVVVVKPGTSDEQINKMCKSNKKGCRLAGHPSNGGVPFLEMRGTEADLEQVIHSAEGAVKFVEPDHEVNMIPELESDDVEAATWGLNRVGADQRSRGGAGATVYVLDTGVRSSHQDFGGRASSALDMTSGELVECNGDVNCARDAQGHGTHCAGSAAGETFGVAPQASVKSVKVLADSGRGSWSWSYSALDWLAQSEVRPSVASMSLGGPGTQQAMREAVDAAVNAGVVVVVAGGNDNQDACKFSPAFIPSAITVGSTTSTDTRSSFSNYGKCTNIWAPGSAVTSASHRSDTGSTTLSGTSMACPHVSGAAALVLQANHNMKPSAVLSELTNTAARDYIKGLYNTDVNFLLNVAAGGAPPPGDVGPGPEPPRGQCHPACTTMHCYHSLCGGCDFC